MSIRWQGGSGGGVAGPTYDLVAGDGVTIELVGDDVIVSAAGGGGGGAGDVQLVNHAHVATTARPSGAASVLWTGSALPIYMAPTDIWSAGTGVYNLGNLPGANLINNSGFETNTTDWAGGHGTIARVTTAKRTGTASLALTPANDGDAGQAQNNQFPAVNAGEAYLFRAFLRTASGTADCYARMGQYTAAYGWIDWNDGGTPPPAVTVTANEWTPISVGGVMAANTAFLQPSIFVPGNGPVVYIDDVALIRATAP